MPDIRPTQTNAQGAAIAASAGDEAAQLNPTVSNQKSKKKVIDKGLAFIHASFNNTIITITDINGNTIAQHSAAAEGYSGSRKSTAFAAEAAALALGNKVKQEAGMRQLEVKIKGPGAGREAIKGLKNSGIKITKVTDCTPVPHNGCKPKKKRRV